MIILPAALTCLFSNFDKSPFGLETSINFVGLPSIVTSVSSRIAQPEDSPPIPTARTSLPSTVICGCLLDWAKSDVKAKIQETKTRDLDFHMAASDWSWYSLVRIVDAESATGY